MQFEKQLIKLPYSDITLQCHFSNYKISNRPSICIAIQWLERYELLFITRHTISIFYILFKNE